MSYETPKKRPLSEIGHLFLSDVRDRHTGGMTPPVRLPPGLRAAAGLPPGPRHLRESIDLTPEECAAALDATDADAGEDFEPDAPAIDRPPARPVTAVLAGHLSGAQSDRVRQYARHLAAGCGRVGLVEVDAAEFRLTCFDPDGDAGRDDDDAPPVCHDDNNPRELAEAIEELNWDVRRWLLVIPNPRTPEAKALLRDVDHWALLTTCDHDGVICAYRTLKGLVDGRRPRLTLAVLDAADAAEAARVHEKLSGVCDQFLGWPLEAEPPVEPAAGVADHLVLFSRPPRDKAQMAAAPQWAVVADLLVRSRGASEEADGDVQTDAEVEVPTCEAGEEDAASSVAANLPPEPSQFMPTDQEAPASVRVRVQDGNAPRLVADFVVPAAPPADDGPAPASFVLPTAPARGEFDVLDLPGPDAPAEAILSAILRDPAAGLVECPVRAPMCPDARLAVGRDRGMALLAVARQGLGELRAIGRAYQWLLENRALISMAVPQFAIDAARPVRLRLLVDQADLSAEALRPLLQTGHVTVQAYRRLRWGGKSGLLLEAA